MGGHSSDISPSLRELKVSGWIDDRRGLWLRYSSCRAVSSDMAPEAMYVRFSIFDMCSSRRYIISDLKLQLNLYNLYKQRDD